MSKQKRGHGALEPTAPKIPEHPFQKPSKSAARKGLCRTSQNLRDFAFLNHLFVERGGLVLHAGCCVNDSSLAVHTELGRVVISDVEQSKKELLPSFHPSEADLR
jgi:hypothetical protein